MKRASTVDQPLTTATTTANPFRTLVAPTAPHIASTLLPHLEQPAFATHSNIYTAATSPRNPRKRRASHMLDLAKSSSSAPPPADPSQPSHSDPVTEREDIDMRPRHQPGDHDLRLTSDNVHVHHHHHHHHHHASLALQSHAPQFLTRLNVAGTIDHDPMSAEHQMCDVTLDSPSSPGGAYKRMRSVAHSDAGSSSCRDVEDPQPMSPDSVPALVTQLRQLLDYIDSKPSLHHGSASFVRDYLRTMLMQNSLAAQNAIQSTEAAHKADIAAGRKKREQCFNSIPDEIAKHIFGFLDGRNLARAREVCRKWNEFASEEPLWRELCLKRWRSLETDPEVWKLIDKNLSSDTPNRWRTIYPKVSKKPQWTCRLQKTGRFICNLVAHQISGDPLGDAGLPEILIVERRFNILHLQTFVLPRASVLYFEPESESDKVGFDDFIEYLDKRTRAGLALQDQRRFIFIPPCDYTRSQLEYKGRSLLGVVQDVYPRLDP